MKVDVTTPDDEGLGTEPSEPKANEPQVDEAEVAAAVDEVFARADALEDQDEVLDAQYEPLETNKTSDEVFSIADIEAARAAAAEAQDRYMRLQAEWDNYRKRTAREREDERLRACEGLVEKLLPVVDDIERAIDHADKSAPEGEFAQFVDGIRAMHAKFCDVFERSGVQTINPIGDAFDMNEHQAIAHVEDASLPEGTVREVYQKGYRMGTHVVRPAMVTVSKGGPAREAEEEQPQETEPAANDEAGEE